ncbi:bifunctional 4-hydroxy-2-oxoglutarate aldolase/2-dehydro-3-deoxy-phosphogluconate aldolase [Niastella yeongjuensis]|uniref:Bifunctional 4-hydroxy-2-oxoglutarate aldolase/2-dehydro-3-deoxy-phosphogluconate aldolase n=1 Tax=Niastella yeongjuensis TaxID=354355 RepID=A0A1V9EN84_9BACT|nr:bifunctional 4-hydroxy-2-oxoglutarate aldolase/2-dehydro-3-deoxy-phosphogluconate aldolase [Niastella yeongjuensis]OQP47404.1 bifunctional 4-hydroxy-2-oxoglutarate aldolase/2-dehydro-3-deoxy-phosphogluconate aldolase [Niastella yeongjuensis]SEN82437.1 2-dehydro-3-deoxyphosphogluconate aldolase / (4S)-4-hydroxy-2-oxoglutarate aldolase [Niastella yeongjuensis]
MNQQDIINQITQQKMLPLYFNKDKEVSIEVLKALYAAGIKAVEYTNRGAEAIANFKEMRKVVNETMPGMLLGIGTVKTVADAELFINAGADFIISPVVFPPVAKVVQDAGLLWIPGCLTPTEVFTAEMNGAKLVKIFPGSVVGPSYISAIKELFPGILFMPTGGVDTTKESIQEWFDNGVCAVGMGSKLISKNVLQNKEYDKLTKLTKDVLAILNNIK